MAAMPESPPTAGMRQAASKRGYAAHEPLAEDHARRLRNIRPDRGDGRQQLRRVHRLASSTEAAAKIYRMVAFCRRSDATYVPDPYYEGHEGFELVLDLLEDACEGLLEDLVKQE